VLKNGALNFGFDDLTEQDERYRWASEYVEVAYKLWEGSWEDDALLRDVKRRFTRLIIVANAIGLKDRICRRHRRSGRR
jgi:alkanesulfonate monooxygenase SsuD/methylene tetrahydromethanopterin reductase-like flavin-dependent oxidoreductase (luciferase family)